MLLKDRGRQALCERIRDHLVGTAGTAGYELDHLCGYGFPNPVSTSVVRCFIKATLKHSKAPGAVRASKKRYPFLRPVISRGCQG